MALYLYAICAAAPEQALGTGIAGRPLRLLEGAGLCALVSEHGPEVRSELGGEPALWQHEEAVERLMSGQDVIPARFATVLEGERELCELLAARRGEFLALLARVAGAQELAVRASWPGAGTSAPRQQSGAAYLATRAESERRTEALAQRLQQALAPLAREQRVLRASAGTPAARAAYLVERESTEGFLAACERLQGELAGASIACTGPWPPYSFVESVS